jgi:hypothetical protein
MAVNGYVGAFYNGGTLGNANGLAVKVASANDATGALDVSRAASQASIGTPLLRVTGSGRVGIGTGSPGGRFHLVTTASGDDDYLLDQYGTTGDQALYFRRIGGTPAAPTNLAGGEQLGGVGFGARAGGSQGYANSAVRAFYTGNGTTTDSDLRFETTATERLRIDAAGNVGVGTTDPSSTLHVDGTLAVGVVRNVPGSTTGTPLATYPAGYLGLTPIGANNQYLLPPASDVPGRQYHVRNNSPSVAATLLTSGGGGFYDSGASSRISSFSMGASGTSKAITLVSDGIDWLIFRAGN